MKLECPADCPVQIVCNEIIVPAKAEKETFYDNMFELLDEHRSGSARLAEIEERVAQNPSLQDEVIMRKISEWKAIASQIDTNAELEEMDAAIDNMETMAKECADTCHGPKYQKRWIIYGEQIIKCTSPKRWPFVATDWLERHDTTAKAYTRLVKNR